MVFRVTQCPSCDSTFNTHPRLLDAAAGRVRCGACLTVFAARDNFLVDELAGETGYESVFVSEPPQDFFDPSAFLTRQELRSAADAEPPMDAPGVLPDEPAAATDTDPDLEPRSDSVSEPDSVPEPRAEDFELSAGFYFTGEFPETQRPEIGSAEIELHEPQASAAPAADEGTEPEQGEQGTDHDYEQDREQGTDHDYAAVAVEDPPQDGRGTDHHEDLIQDQDSAQEVEQSDQQEEQESTSEPTLEEIRARALGHQLHDDEALEALPEANLAALQQFSSPVQFAAGRHRHWGRTLGWSALALVAALGLGAQYLWQQQARLSQEPGLRPLYLQACAVLGCSLQPYRDLDAVRSETLTVRTHPSTPNALRVSVNFRNTAPFPQAFPILVLSFNSAQNSVIALREFAPTEYLDPGLQTREMMPPGAPVQIELDLMDPGRDAVNYTLAFRRP